MKISYINDLHVDNWINYENEIGGFVDEIITSSKNIGEVIIIAGDISHFNSITEQVLLKFSNYFEKVFFVYGNHDYYIINHTQYKQYNNNSINKLDELYNKLKKNDNIIIFNHNNIYYDYKNLRFAGCTMTSKPETEEGIMFYQYHMNDYKFIPNDVNDMNNIDMKIYNEISKLKPDIFISHYPLFVTNSHLKFGLESLSSFMCKVDKYTAPINFFGHVHEKDEYNIDGYKFFTNAYGYSFEYLNAEIQTMEV